MSHKNLFISSCIIILSLSCSSIFAQAWQKKVDKNDVVVYLRDVEGSNFKEFKGETVVKSSLNALVALINDHEAMPDWMYNCSESELLKKLDNNEGYYYSYAKAPWPVSDRDAVTKFSINQNPKTKTVVVTLSGEKDFIPEKSGKVRVESITGKWKFQPIDSETVKVIYQLHTDPSGSIPSSLANSFVVDLPYETLKNLRNEVKKEKYVNANLEGIEEL